MVHGVSHRGSTWWGVVPALVAAATLGLASAAPAAEPVPPSFYGINGQALFGQPLVRWHGELTAMADDGLGTMRKDAMWETAEPDPPDPQTGEHTWVWWPFDMWMKAMAEAHVAWYPILDYGSRWAGALPGDERSAPDPEAFSAYAAAFAGRYGRHGDFWTEHPELPYSPVTDYEIWNEPNLPLFWHGQERAAEDYVDLYLAARRALHAVDPEAVAVAGALSSAGEGSGIPFVQRMIAHRPDAAGQVDAFSYHPYADTALISGWLIAQLRVALDAAFGPGVPLHVTEVGWSTVGLLTDADRARELTWLANALPASGCGVTRFLPHTWLTREQDPADIEDWYGLHNADGTPKPSETAYALAVHAVRQAGPPDDPAYGLCTPIVPPPDPDPGPGPVPAPDPDPPPPDPLPDPPIERPSPVRVPQPPRLTAKLAVHGRTLTVTVRSAAGAATGRTVVATRGRVARTLTRVRTGVFRRTLPRTGRWRVAVRSPATGAWKAQTIVRTVQVRRSR